MCDVVLWCSCQVSRSEREKQKAKSKKESKNVTTRRGRVRGRKVFPSHGSFFSRTLQKALNRKYLFFLLIRSTFRHHDKGGKNLNKKSRIIDFHEIYFPSSSPFASFLNGNIPPRQASSSKIFYASSYRAIINLLRGAQRPFTESWIMLRVDRWRRILTSVKCILSAMGFKASVVVDSRDIWYKYDSPSIYHTIIPMERLFFSHRLAPTSLHVSYSFDFIKSNQEKFISFYRYAIEHDSNKTFSCFFFLFKWKSEKKSGKRLMVGR